LYEIFISKIEIMFYKIAKVRILKKDKGFGKSLFCESSGFEYICMQIA